MANSITGMMKVFYQNFLIDYSNSIVATSGQSGVSSLSDINRTTRWSSVGSTDLITERLDITFNQTQSINRLAFILFNFKDFQALYWNGSAWTHFTNVYTYSTSGPGSLYGTAAYGSASYGSDSIADNGNTLNSRYFEFDTVSTTQIRIECTKTITANDQKYITELYIGKEIGTFIDDVYGQPNNSSPVISDTNAIYLKMSNGGSKKLERSDKFYVQLDLKEVFNVADQTIVDTIYDQGQVAVLMCGAIPYTQRGMRLQDFFHVIVEGNEEAKFANGRNPDMGLNYKMILREQ